MSADRADRQRVRPAGPADLDAIRRIESQAFEPSRRSSPRSLRRALRSAFQQVLVLETDASGSFEVAGYLIVWPFPRTWRIYNLAADPRRRRQGIGLALLQHAVEAARRAGAATVVLESRVDPELLGFYERRGFRAVRRLPNYYSEGEDAMRMALPLAAPD